jgi:hypothetical protein
MRLFTSFFKYMIFAIVVLMLSGFSLWHNPKRDRFLIPEKFTGTVYVYFQVPGAPPLKKEDGYRLIIVPDSGIVKTSSDPIGGKLHDEYWLYSSDGKRRRMSDGKLGSLYTTAEKNPSGQLEMILVFKVLK